LVCVPDSNSAPWIKRYAAPAILSLLAIGCRSAPVPVPPSIEFTSLPPAGEGSPDTLYPIQGRVKNAHSGQRIVLFARSGMWWIQPTVEHPFTTIQRDSAWQNSTHPGTAYAALLVDGHYNPPSRADFLPPQGGSVHAVAIAEGAMLDQARIQKLNFSGYEWIVRQSPGNPAGARNLYNAANAWVDAKGYLHLRVRKDASGWTSAEVNLPRSLGYGTYSFVMSDVSQLEPAVCLTVSSWDASGPYQEMDIEISRWGEAAGKNAQYVVQPYYVPANVVRFLAPPGRLTWSFDWEPGRVAYRTVRDSDSMAKADVVASHLFTSGVPPPGRENIHLNLFVLDNRHIHLQRGTEVIVEKFDYLP
jgi:hypothetical protein